MGDPVTSVVVVTLVGVVIVLGVGVVVTVGEHSLVGDRLGHHHLLKCFLKGPPVQINGPYVDIQIYCFVPIHCRIIVLTNSYLGFVLFYSDSVRVKS